MGTAVREATHCKHILEVGYPCGRLYFVLRLDRAADDTNFGVLKYCAYLP